MILPPGMIELTQLDGEPFYIRSDAIHTVGKALRAESTSAANARVVSYAGVNYVRETREEVLQRMMEAVKQP